ncbi:Leucyl-tRNA synthetase, mitochondrial [Komagataella phaffii CBS 7435]|uniref:leucine--tRNA ligase n=2 Tax=Komagataella phaffii TaxID=460519 RepID=C4QYR3_KOMPG|nr:Mitochondrial leucyl-tRNA synthetase [Komagataella phaffii GS115]AOA61813.1 GQ67_01615T0 [Komagataella phaffii]CAH2447212.1 Leucyl-tRNA synthetase, mitochondrial [Komagataella phaffii CBS 7435]AOA66747.1 GQ68_01631T0 [Komagataella phaffii GS115]CAY68387.1 Mitochondrial leucyl-tRNA synthetase [Komagataella phaffii GS115]CCA37453.1 Leucyl-tRNA synthetase, mitochondrial [Komagataella phaffii CBS 7435]
MNGKRMLDAKWIPRWKTLAKGGLNPRKAVPSTKSKVYNLTMFPYPSGMLHLGHLKVYTISDVVTRFNRMKGYDVIHPMGWDAFGLPAENAAVERKVNPAVWTTSNISKMKAQMEMFLADFDWERCVTTCDPSYYKWTQKIFLLLHEHGLAYRKKAEINWDPIDMTVLANEQVDDEGRSWRSGALVEKKLLEQWFLGITKYASALNKDLDTLDEWPHSVKTMQRNWIGESEGANIDFKLIGSRLVTVDSDVLTCFTTRPDTLHSVQFLALALDHPIIKELSFVDISLRDFVSKHSDSKSNVTTEPDSKDGYMLGLFAENPVDPDGDAIPVYAAPYVIGSYGSGCVMGCPSHDARDYDFWVDKFGDSAEFKPTVVPKNSSLEVELPYRPKQGILNENAGKYAGLTVPEAQEAVVKDLEAKGLGFKTKQYRIRDWLISRQRYWGAPIPIIHCNSCGVVPVPDEDLPVLLPQVEGLVGKGGSPLNQLEEFVNCKCPKCGSDAKRDTDTMDTFMDSSWYFLRYTDPKNEKEIFSKELADRLMPVDKYIGGVEHAILHLLYSRFISKFLHDIKAWGGENTNGEPIKRLITQGMVHGKTFIEPKTGRFLQKHELEISGSKVFIKGTSVEPEVTYEKMSKSKHNGADPAECIQKYGADATRAHILFQAPITDILNWDEGKIVGVQRWLKKVISLAETIGERLTKEPEETKPIKDFNEKETQLFNDVQDYIGSVTDSFGYTLSLNTVISDYMKLTNNIADNVNDPQVSISLLKSSLEKLLTIMAPVTPVTSEEANEILLAKQSIPWQSILKADWPDMEPRIENTQMNFSVMINGKVRFVFSGDKSLVEKDPNAVLDIILGTENGQKHIGSKEVKRVIIKPKMMSFVLGK